jgi:hypothetical protein
MVLGRIKKNAKSTLRFEAIIQLFSVLAYSYMLCFDGHSKYFSDF